MIDRATASRLGITPQLIDDTLNGAFGQRQVAIMYIGIVKKNAIMIFRP